MDQTPTVATSAPTSELSDGVTATATLARTPAAPIAKAPVPLVPTTFDEIHRIAEALKEASLLPDHLRNQPANLRLIILTGAELGFSPAQATRVLYVVKGQVRESALSMLARVKAHPSCEYVTVVESTNTRCVVEAKRKGQPARRHQYTIDDAILAGLATRQGGNGRDNWSMRPTLMLRRRAISELLAEEFADILMGMVSREDAEEEDAAEAARAKAMETRAPEPQPQRLVRLDEPAPRTRKTKAPEGEGAAMSQESAEEPAQPPASTPARESAMPADSQPTPSAEPSGGVVDEVAQALLERIRAADSEAAVTALIPECKAYQGAARQAIGKALSDRRTALRGGRGA